MSAAASVGGTAAMFDQPRVFGEWCAASAWLLLALAIGPLPAAAQSREGIGMAEPALMESGVVVREEQWAGTLVRALALGEVLEDQPESRDLFALLCADKAEMTTQAGGRRAPARAAFRISEEMVEDRAPGEPVRVVLDVPATALYQLAVEGEGKQRWTVDQRKAGHLDPSALGVAFGPRVVPLREGPHELAGYLAPRSRVDRVELVAHRPLCIAPAAGWRVGEPLTGGALARTLVRALGLDRSLPEEQVVVELEGERFESSSDWGSPTNAPPPDSEAETRAEWARAGEKPTEFTYRVRLLEPGVFSVLAQVVTGGEQIWSIDGRYRTRMDVVASPEPFAWGHVMTTSLAAGEHVIRALVPPGSGIDRIRIVKRQSSDADYIEVLEQMGLRVGGANTFVTRSGVQEAVFHPAFQELADGFLERAAGSSAEAPLVVFDDRVPPLYTRPLSPVLPADL